MQKETNEIAKYTDAKPTVLARKKSVVKKAIVGHLAGIRSEKDGLIYKALKNLNDWLDGDDNDLKRDAVDKIIKLLPYVVEKEAAVDSITNGGRTVNIQVNNFSDFIKERIEKTNLGGMLGDVLKKHQDAQDIEYEDDKDG